MAWVSQGAITDRTRSTSAARDVGVAMLRKMFKENMEKVGRRRGPARHRPRDSTTIIDLPCEKDKFGAGATFADAWINGGSMRYSPIKQQLLELHADALGQQGQKAGAGA